MWRTISWRLQYSGSWIALTKHDVDIRNCKSMESTNKATLVEEIRTGLANMETIQLYSSDTLMLNKQLQKRLNGTYTRMLHAGLTVSWRQHM